MITKDIQKWSKISKNVLKYPMISKILSKGSKLIATYKPWLFVSVDFSWYIYCHRRESSISKELPPTHIISSPIGVSAAYDCIKLIILLAPFWVENFIPINPKKAWGSISPPSHLSSTISSFLNSYLMTFHFKPSHKSWKSHFWSFFHQLQKNCRWSQMVSIIFD